MDLTNEQKGRRAKEILDDPVFLDVVRTTREGILAQWNLTGYDQSEARENLYHQGRALDEILRGLRTLTTDWTIEKSRNKTRKGRK
jgi:hypothetical protein